MIHPTADVSASAEIGSGTKVWHRAQICAGASVGDECIIGSGVYIDRDVIVGNRVKIQTGAQLYHGSEVEDGVFIGPLACLSNDRHPRAITTDGRLQSDADWELGRIRVRFGASLGAGAIVLPGVVVGRFAMVGAGAVVTSDVPDHALVVGVPAHLVGYVCACGHQLVDAGDGAGGWSCRACGSLHSLLPGSSEIQALSVSVEGGEVRGHARAAAAAPGGEGHPAQVR